MKKLLLSISLFCCVLITNAQWAALGSGLTGTVHAITVFNNEIVAGGNIAGNHHIAIYTGSAWSTLGGGFNDSVNALTIYAGKLYAAGNFTADMNARALGHIAVYNTATSQWDQVGPSGLNNFVRALYSDGTYLYAGGAFNGSGTPAVSRIAKFDGTSWSQVGDVPTSVVNTITKYNGSIYIGGAFSSFIGKLNGTAWQYISGLNFEVLCLEPFGSQLYIGGKFNAPSQYIATYNGSSIGSGFNTLNNWPFAMYATPSNLFCGGAFTSSPSSGASLPHFFMYSGSSPFVSVGTGFNGTVYAISNQAGKIIVGGSFTTAGGTAANNIAISSQTINVSELSPEIQERNFYPNPTTGQATLHLVSKEALKKPVLRVMDFTSKKILEMEPESNSLSNEYEFHVPMDSFGAGIYYYSVSDQDGKILATDKFILQ